MGDHCQRSAVPTGERTSPPAAGTIAPSPNATHAPSWLNRTGGAAPTCTRVRSSHVSRSSISSAPPSTHATVPRCASPPASRVDGHDGTTAVGEEAGSAEPDPSRSGRNSTAATPPPIAATATRAPMSLRLVIQRPWAYMWRPVRGIPDTDRTPSPAVPCPDVIRRASEPRVAAARTTSTSNERSSHAIAAPPTHPSDPDDPVAALGDAPPGGLPQGRVLTQDAASGRRSTPRARRAPAPVRSRSRARAAAWTNLRA